MTEKPKIPVISDAVRGTVEYAVRSREGLREGLRHAQSGRLHAPPDAEHAHRLLYGLSAPITLMRMSWADADLRRSIVRRLIPPLACVALFAVVGIGGLVEDLVMARHQPLALKAEIDDDDDKDDGDKGAKADRDEEEKEAADELKSATAGIASTVRDSKMDRDGIEHAVAAAALAGQKVEAAEKAAREKAAARAAAKAAAKGAVAKPPAPEDTSLAAIARVLLEFVKSKLAKLIVTLSVLEWILVWIGREHHDQISYEVSRLTGVPGEALASEPRLRLDFAWLKMKGWRTVRFLIFLALGSPLAWLVGMVPHVGGVLAVAVEGAWAAYWASVFAIGNSFLVWEVPLAADDAPWFIRVLRPLGRIPVLGFVPRAYARVLTIATRNVWQACLAFEKTPWESAGLAALRGVMSVPVLYIVTRPFFGPAATHAWVARTASAGDAYRGPPAGGALSAPDEASGTPATPT